MIKKFKKSLLFTVFASFSLSLCGCEQIGKELSNIPDMLQGKAEIATNNALNGDVVKQYRTAIENGNIEWIKEIVANNPDLDVNYVDDGTAIYCACYDSNIIWSGIEFPKFDVIKELIRIGADPNIGNTLQNTTYNKDYFFTKALLQYENIDLYSTDISGNTSLGMANENQTGGLGYNAYRQVQLMIQAGAEPYPELFWAGNEDDRIQFESVCFSPMSTRLLMNMLLDSGEDSGLKKALEYAFSGKINECVNEAVTNGADEYTNQELYMITLYTIYFGSPENYEALEQNGLVTEWGTNVIAWACETDNLNMVKYLCDKYNICLVGEDKDEFASRGLGYAARWGYTDICRYFCDLGVEMKSKYGIGYDELKKAILSENIETVKVIYDYIIKHNGLSEFELGQTYFEIEEGGYVPENIEKAKEIIDFFFSQGYNMVNVEFEGMGKEIAEYLYQKGRPLNPTDLSYAVYSRNIDYVKLVLDKGADPNQNAFVRVVFSPWNISISDSEIIPYNTFDENNSTYAQYNVTYRDFIGYYSENRGITERSGVEMLWTAIEYSNSDVVKMLIDYGADVNHIDYLKYATNSSAQTLRVLLDAGADINIDCSNIGDKNAKTLAEFYERNGRSDLAQIVREYNNN